MGIIALNVLSEQDQKIRLEAMEEAARNPPVDLRGILITKKKISIEVKGGPVVSRKIEFGDEE